MGKHYTSPPMINFEGFTQNELTELLGQNIIPTRLHNTFNSVVVWAKDYSWCFLTPISSLIRNEYMVRLKQQGEEAQILRGSDANQSARHLIADAGYYEISSGYNGNSLNLELGVSKQRDRINVIEAIGMTQGFGGSPFTGVDQVPAMTVYVDYKSRNNIGNYKNRGNIKVGFSFSDYRNIDVEQPQTKEQAVLALRHIGEVIQTINEGKEPNLKALRSALIEDVGLKTKPTDRDVSFMGVELETPSYN